MHVSRRAKVMHLLHRGLLIPVAVFLCSSVSLKAQTTVTYEYTGNQFNLADCLIVEPLLKTYCATAGNVTARAKFNLSSPTYTGCYTTPTSLVVDALGATITFPSADLGNTDLDFCFMDGSLYTWTVNLQYFVNTSPVTSNSPFGINLQSATFFSPTGSDEVYSGAAQGVVLSSGVWTQVPACPVNFGLWFLGPYMKAQLTAPNVFSSAKTCGFDHFDWQQLITNMPAGGAERPNTPGDPSLANNLAPGGSLMAPPPFNDPPPGGWAGPNYEAGDNPFPVVYPYPAFFTPGGNCTVPRYGSVCDTDPTGAVFPYVVSSNSTTLSFVDGPAQKNLSGNKPSKNPTGNFMAFWTALVGVDAQGTPHPLHSWTWNTTCNGRAGGTDQTVSIYPIDPGSGTGGVTITSIDGVQLPTAVLPSQVAMTLSGLLYSRVSQTFNGTVTITNIGSSAISGPFQIVFFGMPANVTLVNATGNLSGTPYLTVPAVASLAPGQSATVSVQFKNPSNVTIDSTPVIYSGSIN
jgi:hypothetical protein